MQDFQVGMDGDAGAKQRRVGREFGQRLGRDVLMEKP